MLSTQQAGDILGVSRVMIANYIRAGTLPAERIGKVSWVIREADVKRFKRPRVGRPKKK